MHSPIPHTETGADARLGLIMLTVFGLAVVLVSLAVALIAIEPTWWMLGAVFAFHVAATGVVTAVIARALSERRRSRLTAPSPVAPPTPVLPPAALKHA